MKSIRLSLLKWLILPLLGINLAAAGLTYWIAWAPTQAAFDHSLANAALSLAPSLREREGSIELSLSKQTERFLRTDPVDMVYFAVRDERGSIVAGDVDFPLLIEPSAVSVPLAYDGVMRGKPVRIVSLKVTLNTEDVLIGVAETRGKRNQVNAEIAYVLLSMEALLLILLVAIIWIGVGMGLRPLQQMRTQLNARNHDNLSEVSASNLPAELNPLVQALNGLLDRTYRGKLAQQDFLANVAHQLRTPLSGLKTQLAWLAHRYCGDAEAAHSSKMMMSSVDRMIRRTNQLLALARAEPSQFEKQRLEDVDLEKLVEESVQHFVKEADKKSIDLGFDLHPTRVPGDSFLLRDLIDNLVDNAIRYSPEKATVTVRCMPSNGGGTLIVEDTGPGIAATERDKIFDRFYRLNDEIAGSGLGLAIVRDIAATHEAAIEVQAGANQVGTIISVRFGDPAGKGA